MDEEWDLMESSMGSTESNTNNDYRPSLDFNRFSTMPAYVLDDEQANKNAISYISEEQQVEPESEIEAHSIVSETEADVSNILCESPLVSDHEFSDLLEEDITLGYNHAEIKQSVDDDESYNNQSIENNEPDIIINPQERPNGPISFLSSINLQGEATRESLVDKHTIWKNSTIGSSVPYMSNQPSSPHPPSPPKEKLSKYFYNYFCFYY